MQDKQENAMTTGLAVSRPPSGAGRPLAAAGDIPSVDTCPADGLPEFLRLRPRLFGVACRMLASASEAEDIVQDVWVRWQTTDQRTVRNPAAFLLTITTRLALNVLQSARVRRESAVGSWLPEPVDPAADATRGAERREALQSAVVLLLETLSPSERAGYVLREAFNYQYREIAAVLRVEEANARQIVTRARARVTGRRRTPANATKKTRLLEAFTAAARTGDLAALESLLASDAVSPVRCRPATRAHRTLPDVARPQVCDRRRHKYPCRAVMPATRPVR
jgi:RNA polymerase sigma-70 factor (ECF subfamily)